MARQTQASIKRFQDALEMTAEKKGMSPDAIALLYMENNKRPVKQWLAKHGKKGSDNPASLAAQVLMQHDENIQNFVGSSFDGMPYDEAENAYFDEIERQQDLGIDGLPDGFSFGATLGVAKKVGGKLVQKINDKRAKKGKTAILAKFQANNTGVIPTNLNAKQSVHFGTATPLQVKEVEQEKPTPIIDAIKAVAPSVDDLARQLDAQVEANKRAAANVNASNTGNTGSTRSGGFWPDAKEVVNAGLEEVESIKTKDAINKYLPYAIAAVVIIFAVAFFTGRKSA